MVEPKPDIGTSIAAEALREKLAKIEAQYERDRKELTMALRNLSGKGYLHLEVHEAIWRFLQEHPDQHDINAVADQLVEFGVPLAGTTFDARHVAKITAGQPTFKHIFQYNKDTELVSLTPWAMTAKVGTQPEGLKRRKRKRRSRPPKT